MKLKLSSIDFMSLLHILKVAAMQPKERKMADKLVQIMIIRIYRKFHKNELDVKKLYSIKLDEEEAVAFWIYFAYTGLPSTSHAGNLIESIRAIIHQKFI